MVNSRNQLVVENILDKSKINHRIEFSEFWPNFTA